MSILMYTEKSVFIFYINMSTFSADKERLLPWLLVYNTYMKKVSTLEVKQMTSDMIHRNNSSQKRKSEVPC
jgi:hypothetical protein